MTTTQAQAWSEMAEEAKQIVINTISTYADTERTSVCFHEKRSTLKGERLMFYCIDNRNALRKAVEAVEAQLHIKCPHTIEDTGTESLPLTLFVTLEWTYLKWSVYQTIKIVVILLLLIVLGTAIAWDISDYVKEYGWPWGPNMNPK